MEQPAPEPLSLPADDASWRSWLQQRCRTGLADAAAAVAALKDTPTGDRVVLELWNDACLALDNAFATSRVLALVHPDPEVIAAAEALEIEARAFSDDLRLDADVFAQLESLDPTPLDAGSRRVLQLALRDFRRAGVALDEAAREQVRAVNRRESELTQAFARGIRDGRLTTRVPAAALSGLPEDFVSSHPADEDGLVAITTEYPDTHPFLTHSRDAGARRAVALSFGNLGWPHNDAVLAELLELRAGKAGLLGYADWPSYDAEVTMIGTGEEIAKFIDAMSELADAAARRDLATLEEAARREGEGRIDVSNVRHFLEAIRRDRFGVDEQEVRRYFDAGRVRQGLLDVTGRLFGLAYEQVAAPAWHPEVTTYDVSLAENGRRLGRIHLDLHPRERKFNHAAQFTLVSGVNGRQLAEGVLACNFPRGLMSHADVVTLFHEFGHLMHHVLAGHHDWVRFSGVATEWDFVEAPSQMLEEWAWDADVLREFAVDAEGRSIPEDLVQRMRAAEEFAKAFQVRTQMGYAAVSYWLHQDPPEDLTTRVLELTERHSLVAPLPDTHPQAGFGHLEDYTSGYYTYLWSLVIAKDLFSAFDPDDLFAVEVARRYRDTVLAAGGSADAADLVEQFLGRRYDDRAFRTWLG